MMIETTVMRYGHDPAGMIRIILNESALERWARSLHVSSFLEQNLPGLKGNGTNKSVTHHKEESKEQIKIDSTDCDKLRKYLVTSIVPFSVDDHLQEIVYIHSGKLSAKEIDVDPCKTLGEKQLLQLISDLPDGFYKPLTAAVLTMKKLKKSMKVNEVEVIDKSLIYSRVIALQLTNVAVKAENVFSFEVSPVLTSMFDNTDDMKSSKSKSSLSDTGKKVKKPELVVIDGCIILWVVNWPINGLVSDYIANYCDLVFLKLQSHDIAIFFDRYHDFNIKSSTRVDRGKFSARTHFLIPSSPLSGKSATLTSASCKSQIIRYITDGLIQRAVLGCYPTPCWLQGC